MEDRQWDKKSVGELRILWILDLSHLFVLFLIR